MPGMISFIRKYHVSQIAICWLLILSVVSVPVASANTGELCGQQSDVVVDCDDCGFMSSGSDHSGDHQDHQPADLNSDCHANAFCAPDLPAEVSGFVSGSSVIIVAPEAGRLPPAFAASETLPTERSLNFSTRAFALLYCRYLI